MRQALFAGVTALLMAFLLPGWLLPEKTVEQTDPLVLVIEQPGKEQRQPVVELCYAGEIRSLPLEEYLVGVVLAEMPASFEEEALKAQAVAARTFAVRQMKNGKHTDCSLCADSTCCQAWSCGETLQEKLGDSWQYYWEKAKTAVTQTAGEVLTYNGELIDAVYFSCSGGRTEDAVAVWGSEVPYLQSVVSGGEEAASVFESQVAVDIGAFQSTILQHVPEADFSLDPSQWVGSAAVTDGGGVDHMEIGGCVINGTDLRRLFHLNSTDFVVSVTDESVVFSVRGYGHRVGLSQYGANAMAKTGCTYREILLHYYTGVTLSSMA